MIDNRDSIEKTRIINFLANMSHEIRTPMNAILGMAELALREQISDTAAEYIMSIKQASENLLDIVNNNLVFSKIETGRLDSISIEYSLSSLIGDVISVIKPNLLKSNLRFVVHVDNDLPGKMIGDVVRIRQIMLNLLSNAVKYTDKGFVSFNIFGKPVDDNNIELIFTVEDSGKGIEKENLDSLFDEFAKFDLVKNIGIEGTGLGLAITKSLIESMNGTIRVESEYGKGSVFTAVLPQTISGTGKLAEVYDRENHNILIFERRDICINSIKHTMNDLNVKFKMVSSTEEFLKELSSNKYTFIFLAAALYDSVIAIHGRKETNAMIVLIAEFGEVIPVRNVSVLTTPIFSIPIANILNDISDRYTQTFEEKNEFEFTAPDAMVLVVDDLVTNLKVIEGLLEPYNLKIDKAKSGFEAIKAVTEKKYDLVFMDYVMPEMDGITATSKIRDMGKTDPYFYNVPIIALTANVIPGSEEMFLTSGFNDYISKPIDPTLLHTVLKKRIPEDKIIYASSDEKMQSLTPDDKGIDVSRMITELNDLMIALENYDIRKIGDLSDVIKIHSKSSGYENEIKEILRYRLTGEYDEAVSSIKKLIAYLMKNTRNGVNSNV